MRVGMVNYRDHCDSYVTMVHHLDDDIVKTKKFIDKSCASGGGDFPEAVCCGLNDALNVLKWRDDAVKIVILIADAPPHGLGLSGDSFPKGSLVLKSESNTNEF